MTGFRYQVWALFLVKLMAAVLYGVICLHRQDTWGYFYESVQARQIIDAGASWHMLLPGFHGWSDLLHYPFWADLRENVFVDVLMLLNLVTGSRYFIDVALFTGITFAGTVRFLRVLRWLYPSQTFLAYLLPFLIPSFLYWESGMHPDTLLVCLLFCAIYEAYCLAYIRRTTSRMVRLACWVILIGLLKPYLLLLALPTALAWALIYRRNWKPVRAWALALGGGLLIAVCTGLLPAANIPREIADRQALFQQTGGGTTRFPEPTLKATAGSYLSHFPMAAWIAAVGSPIWFLPHYWALILEGLLLLVLFWACLLRRVRWSAFETGWIVYALLNFLLIGYTISNGGAIERYRAMFLPFIFAPFFFPLLRTLSTESAGQRPGN